MTIERLSVHDAIYKSLDSFSWILIHLYFLLGWRGMSPNRNMSKLKGWTLQRSLLTLWMDENSNQQSN